MSFFKACVWMLIATMSCGVFADEKIKIEKSTFHLFLLVGQSNMAGRGKIEAEDKEVVERVLSLNKDGKWVAAVDPIHFDKRAAGVGLGRTFGILVSKKYPDITVGLIPCACGGSPIGTWVPGAYHKQTKSHPYDDAIKRARLAMKDGELKAILWHQGEGDCSAKSAPLYEKNLSELIARFRKDLGMPELPVIIGQLGKFKKWNSYRVMVDKAQRDVVLKDRNAAFVGSDGLTCNPDQVHFDAASLREFGKRYFEAYLKLNSDQRSAVAK
ncbi:MAG: sialate O-acetylesterase [Victivallales bacterium]|nr:sialate O-acetylesterase [Victivallales bacterium]